MILSDYMVRRNCINLYGEDVFVHSYLTARFLNFVCILKSCTVVNLRACFLSTVHNVEGNDAKLLNFANDNYRCTCTWSVNLMFSFFFRMQVRFRNTLTCTFNVHTCYVSMQMNVSIANHLNTENAWYFAQTVNNTNMYLVMVRENQNYASHECMCGRESPDGAAVPPKCVFDRLSGRTDRINYQIRQDRLGIIDQDHRCECPCFSRDLRYQGCDVKFSEE